jgi:hypothetical protein
MPSVDNALTVLLLPGDLGLTIQVDSILILPFKSKSRLEAENVALRHQVMVLRRQVGGRVHLTNFDRLFLVQLYHWFPSIRRVLAIVHTSSLPISRRRSMAQLLRSVGSYANRVALKFT